MTIASSVIDVRSIEDGKLFFYRVGCVPEAYVWSVLRTVTGSPKTVITARLPTEQLQTVRQTPQTLLLRRNNAR